MNKEERIQYVLDSIKDNVAVNIALSLVEECDELQQENKQLKDNWNKLKEYIVNEYFMFIPLNATTKSIMILLEKMQELEKGDSNE